MFVKSQNTENKINLKNFHYSDNTKCTAGKVFALGALTIRSYEMTPTTLYALLIIHTHTHTHTHIHNAFHKRISINLRLLQSFDINKILL